MNLNSIEIHGKKIMLEKVCEECGKSDETVEETIDPYALEISNAKIKVCICSDCYHERVMDI